MLLFPLLYSYAYSLLFFSFIKWSFKFSILIYFTLVLYAELIEEAVYYYKTGVNVFNDIETGAVGMLVLIIHFSIGLFVLFVTKPRSYQK